MSRTGEIVEYGAMGLVLTYFFYFVVGFAPALVLGLEIADTFGEWKGTFEGSASWIFCGFFGILAGVQVVLQQHIRKTWGILLVWWLLSIHPFLMWLGWFGYGKGPFSGVDWMPW